MGMWGPRDKRIQGHKYFWTKGSGDMGMREHEDVGTHGDAVTQEHRHVGTRGLWGTPALLQDVPSVPELEQRIRGAAWPPRQSRFLPANRSRPGTTPGPRRGHASSCHHQPPWRGPYLPGCHPAEPSSALALTRAARCHRAGGAAIPVMPRSPEAPGEAGPSVGCCPAGRGSAARRQVGDTEGTRRCQEAKAGCRSPGRSRGGPVSPGPRGASPGCPGSGVGGP